MNNNEMKEYAIAAAKKDNQAMEILYKELYTDVVYICRSLNLNEEDAKDVAQETFIKAFSQLDKLEDKGKFKQWLFRIANNKCLDLLRHNKVIQFDSIETEDFNMEIPDKSKSTDDVVIEKETSQLLLSIIEKLPVEQRTTVFLFYYQDYSVKEIAVMYGCSENTVRSRLNYAKKFMVKEIDKLDTDKKNRCLVLLPFIYMVFANQRQAFACEIPNCVSVVSAVMAGAETTGPVATGAQSTVAGVSATSTQSAVTGTGAKSALGGASMTGKSGLIKIIIGIICAALVAGAVIVGAGILGNNEEDSKKGKNKNESSVDSDKGEDTVDKNEEKDNNAGSLKDARNKLSDITLMTVAGYVGYEELNARFIDVKSGVFEDVGTWYGYGKYGLTDTDSRMYMYSFNAGGEEGKVEGVFRKAEYRIDNKNYEETMNALFDEMENAGVTTKQNEDGEIVISANLDMRNVDVIFDYFGVMEDINEIEGEATVEVTLYEDFSIKVIEVINKKMLESYKESYIEGQLDAVLDQIGAGAKLEFAYNFDGIEPPFVSDEFEQLTVPGTISALYRDYPAQYTINMGNSWDWIAYRGPEMYSEKMGIDGAKNGFAVQIFFIDETDYEDRKMYSKEEIETLVNGASYSMSDVFSYYKNEDIVLTWTTINGMEMCYDDSSESKAFDSAMGTLAVVKCAVGDEERAVCILIEDKNPDTSSDVDTTKDARKATLEEIVSAMTVKKIERPRIDREDVKGIAESVW